jgi:hypothetical protein
MILKFFLDKSTEVVVNIRVPAGAGTSPDKAGSDGSAAAQPVSSHRIDSIFNDCIIKQYPQIACRLLSPVFDGLYK